MHAKAVLVEAPRVLPEMTTTLHSVTRHTYLAQERGPTGLVLVNLSGRGDKDTRTVAALEGERMPAHA